MHGRIGARDLVASSVCLVTACESRCAERGARHQWDRYPTKKQHGIYYPSGPNLKQVTWRLECSERAVNVTRGGEVARRNLHGGAKSDGKHPERTTAT